MSDDLDRLLDEGLASYSSREPRPGMNARVMARVHADGRTRWFRAGARAVAAALAAAALVVVFVPHRTRPVPAPVVAANSAVVVPARTAVLPPVRPKPAHRVVRTRREPPKRDLFPTPTPLTAGERALMAFARQYPEQMAAIGEDLRRSAEPIQIEPVRIPELRIDEIKEPK